MAGVAVILGSGRSVFDDLRAIQAIAPAPSFFAANYAILFAPTVHHGVSHHQNELPHLVALRARGMTPGARDRVVTHASAGGPGVDHVWPQFRGGRSGSSALLATRIALELGHESVIVAGCPLDGTGHVWDDPHPAVRFRDYARYRDGWHDARAILAGRVTAVSGYLAELLGRPAQVLAGAIREPEGVAA